jgi:anti-sigma B factor antagonist
MHRITVERQGSATVIAAHGELDAFVAPDLTATFAEVVDDANVVTDLDAVSFLDSTALGLVVHGVREVGERGGNVRVVLPRGSARRIFEITTLDRVLPIAASREEALAQLDSAQDRNPLARNSGRATEQRT